MSAGIVDRRQAPGPADRLVRARALLTDSAVLATAALTVLAGVLRFFYIAHQGFWFDEGNTALLVHRSLGGMLTSLPRSESTPPVYYYLAWVWARVFGFSEGPLRSLSAVFGLAVVPVAFALARKLFSARAGVVAAALVACNPLLIWYSQEARAYELLVLLTGVSLLAALYAHEEPTPRRAGAWAVSAALALATHYYALLAVVPQALWLLSAHRHRRAVQVAVGCLGVWGLALLPLAVHQENNKLGTWIAHAPLGVRLGQLVPQFLAGFQLKAAALLVPVAGAAALMGLVLVWWHGDGRTRRAAILTGGLALGGLVLNLLLIAAGFDDLLTRNLLALWLPAALTVAAGLGTGRREAAGVPPMPSTEAATGRRAWAIAVAGPAGVIATVVLCAVGVASAIGVDVNRDYQKPDWRGVAALLGTRPAAATGERVILIQHYRDLLPLSLYLPGLRFVRGHQRVRVREFDVVSFTSPPSSGFCWWGSACNLWPSQMQQSYALRGFHPLWRKHVYQFSVLRMVSAHPQVMTLDRARATLRSADVRRRWELLAQP